MRSNDSQSYRENRRHQPGQSRSRGNFGKTSDTHSSSRPQHIPSPYGFVPLAHNVVFPAWGKQISMDVPFSDGICGALDITLTAETDIIIGDGSDDTKGFFTLTRDGDFAVPGTSVKGMLRNIIEIIGFAKMNLVDDKRYAVRDLHNRPLYGQRLTEEIRRPGSKQLLWKPRARAREY